ncbi:MAG: hypothetical protein ACP5XB_29930 [Isosphaeraceae bacterium]
MDFQDTLLCAVTAMGLLVLLADDRELVGAEADRVARGSGRVPSPGGSPRPREAAGEFSDTLLEPFHSFGATDVLFNIADLPHESRSGAGE